MSKSRSTGQLVIAAMVIVLVILHQDNWMWDNDTLVAGFMPITLLYHAGISLAAGITWFTAIKIAWPTELDAQTEPKTGADK